MAAEELKDHYSRNVCYKMICPFYDCSMIHIPGNQDLENGEEYAFVVKPDKPTLFLGPPIFGCIFGPCCCRSIDVHRVSKNGQLRITRYNVCDTSEEAYNDIVGMRASTSINEGRTHYQFVYKCSTGDAGVALTVGHSTTSINEKSRVMKAVNTFLQQRRHAVGGQALSTSETMELLKNQVSMLAQQQNQGAINTGNQQTPAMPMAGNMQANPVAHPMAQHSGATMNMSNQPQSQVPVQGEFGGQGTAYPGYPYQQPQPGVSRYMDRQGASPQGAASANGNFNDPANQSSQTTASSYQPEEPPPSYQI